MEKMVGWAPSGRPAHHFFHFSRELFGIFGAFSGKMSAFSGILGGNCKFGENVGSSVRIVFWTFLDRIQPGCAVLDIRYSVMDVTKLSLVRIERLTPQVTHSTDSTDSDAISKSHRGGHSPPGGERPILAGS